ncbi:hypothetical protein FHL15_006284 [Xylaria flabelliformis]|uniref:Zn(2)-C6 fungal-type domain-containing protein n=1 Tax=Xylaria flabelliformis TaxID=2512241 RepID=A0A553HY49_9PEZI|nr:hypothetical protein FHL15_006284 [Xylaria flabelliformis]
MPPPAPPSTSMNRSASASRSLRFRLSCDRCQSDKVRCSRDKPSCKRCERRQLGCVYSPFRHIGRPRKVVAEIAHAEEQNAEDADDDSDSVVRPISGLFPDGECFEIVFASLLTTVTDSLGHGASAAAGGLDGPDGSCAYALNSSVADIGTVCSEHPRPRNHTDVLTPPLSQQVGLTSHDDDQLLRSAVDVWVHKHQLPLNTPSDSQHSSTPQGSGASPCDVNYSVTPQSRLTQNSQDEVSCYATILRQTAKLEEELARTLTALPIDLVFETVGDFSSLQHHVLECSGHQQTRPSTAISATHTSSCLTSNQPIVLGLALLAERVVGMLESLVRLAAKSAQSTDRANDVLWWTGATQEPDLSARRLQRSFRTNWVKGCVSLETEADRNLCLGTFVVQGQAKSAAMKRILKLRVRRMLSTLEALQGTGRMRQAGNDKSDQFSASPLDWGGSGAVLGNMADTLLSDLRRRMDSVQGALVLF